MADHEWLIFLKALWSNVVRFLPKWVLRKLFPLARIQQGLLVIPKGEGCPLSVVPGRPMRVGPIVLKAVNLLPFPVELENITGTMSIESQTIGQVNWACPLTVSATSSVDLSMTYDLNENQASMVRKYPSDCPIFCIQGAANLRTPLARLTLPIDVRITSFVHKQQRT